MIDTTGLTEEQIETVRAFAHAVKNQSVDDIEALADDEWIEKLVPRFRFDLNYRITESAKTNLRPWTYSEAIGRAIKFKAYDQAALITHANDSAFHFAGYVYSPTEVLLYCEQIDGKPCGEVE